MAEPGLRMTQSFMFGASVNTMSLMIVTVHAGLGGGGLDSSQTIVMSNCRQYIRHHGPTSNLLTPWPAPGMGLSGVSL